MTNEAVQRPSQIDIMVDELTRRIASLSVEAASWKARAVTAEQALEDLAAEQTEDGDGEEQ